LSRDELIFGSSMVMPRNGQDKGFSSPVKQAAPGKTTVELAS
jgi:hypothetical protein